MKNRISIILARGGSKRIPRKNLIDFFGKPLIAWTIQAAINSNCFKRILVSTDDQEIADVARKYGAEVPFLRNRAADDFSTSSEATFAALNQAMKYWNEEYDTVVQLMANCPLRDYIDIKHCIRQFDDKDTVSQISCYRFGWMNPWWAATKDKTGVPNRIFEDKKNPRSQDLPDLYGPTGAIWMAKTSKFLIEKDFYMAGHCFEELSMSSSVDIDDMEDYKMAKALYLMKTIDD